MRHHLFANYVRGWQMKQASGARLGLYLVKRIVDLHHGSITLSTEEQPGVIFEVEIPKA